MIALDADDTTAGQAGGLPEIVDRAIARDVDAVLHTGNLFRRPTPTDADVSFAIDTLERLVEHSIDCYAISGRREVRSDQSPITSLNDAGVIDHLGSKPVILDGTVALYGIDYTEEPDVFAEQLENLTEERGMTYTIVAAHQHIWPPAKKDESVIGALEAADTAAPFISEIAAGGRTSPATWEADRYSYRVTYTGSSNPAAIDDDPVASLVTVDDHETATRTPVPIFTTEPDSELELLKSVCKQEPVEYDDLDTETLVDLYGLSSKAKSSIESRRRELRDELTDRLADGEQKQGQYATVRNVVQTRRNLRDEDEVVRALEDAGIDPNEVVEISSKAVRKLADNGDVAGDRVFDEQERVVIQRSDLSL
ncbi:exonuclease SbcCD subunit D [Natronorubrum sp. A-ect3]|uniref:metallophosphoesterase family protein n=1 Tax=Natronorubrum sp. A-ect3 TaxID=3242698 RepID=UPI00359CCFAA